ncbi:MAG: 8-amino-7-oxononanoate synthase [bacterium]|nr:8-amino-7-oxononanoate synthase [bacterium]
MGWIEEELAEIRDKGLFRLLRTVETAQGSRVRIDGREMILLCSNDYLGLANHPKVKEAAHDAIEKYGFGSGASRLISGSMTPHREFEDRFAKFKGTEAALLFNSGYAANTGVIPAITGFDDTIFSDRLNHASIVDGCRLSRADFRRYRHLDMKALERYLIYHSENNEEGGRKIIVTDGVFSMDGDIAPLDKIVALSKEYDCMLMVDDAHGTGVLGASGKGSAEHFGIATEDIYIYMGTLGKALGSYGAYVAGSRELIDYLVNKARSFIYSTSLPPAMAAAAIASIEIMEDEPERRRRLLENAALMRHGLRDIGFEIMDSHTQIIPILTGDSGIACKMMDLLMDEGVYVLAIRPPSVPEGTSRLRVTVTSEHSQDDLNKAIAAFKKCGKKAGIV